MLKPAKCAEESRIEFFDRIVTLNRWSFNAACWR